MILLEHYGEPEKKELGFIYIYIYMQISLMHANELSLPSVTRIRVIKGVEILERKEIPGLF